MILARKIGMIVFLTTALTLFLWGQSAYRLPRILGESLPRLGGAVLDIVLVLAMLWVAGALGLRLLQRLNLGLLSPYERVGLTAGVGLGVMSLGALVLGLVGAFNALFLWGWWGVLALISLKHLLAWVRDLRYCVGRALLPTDTLSRWIVFFGALWAGIALVIALAPPSAWDAMAYHLVIPQRYLADGRILANPDNHFFGFPQGLEVLFAFGMALGRDTMPAALHSLLGILALLATGGFVRRYVNAKTAYLAVLLLMTSDSLWLLASVPYVDYGIMLYGILGVIAVTTWRKTAQNDWLILAGVLCGMALGVKYTGGILCIALFVYVLVFAPQNRLRALMKLVLSAVAVFALWMLKGAILYGNPFYPYIIGGLGWDAYRNALFNGAGQGLLDTSQWGLWAFLPFSASLFGYAGGDPFNFTLGAWLMTLPFLLVFVWDKLPDDVRAWARSLLPLWGIMLLAWYTMSATSGIGSQPRLQVALMPLMAIGGALVFYGTERLPKRPLEMGFFLRSFVGLTCVISLINMGYNVGGLRVVGYFFGTETRNAYIENTLGTTHKAIQALSALPDGAKVLMLWEPLTYYCPAQVYCDSDAVLDHWVNALYNGQTPDSAFEVWRNVGYTHVLVHGLRDGIGVGYDLWKRTQPRQREALSLFPDALERAMLPVWTDDKNVHTLYTWKDIP